VRPATETDAPRTGAFVILSRREVLSVLATVLLMTGGFGMVLPIVPLYARSFEVSLGLVGAFIAAFGLARLVFDLVGGWVVDRLGERVVAVCGLGVMGAASLLTGLAPSYLAAAALWALGGAGSSVVFAALYRHMLSVVPKTEMARTFGVFYGTFNIGFIAGAPLGGWLAHAFGLHAPFIAYAGALAVAAFLYAVLVQDSRDPADGLAESHEDDRAGRRLKDLVANRGFLAACAANLAYLWMVGAIFDTLVPLLGREGIGMSTAGIGIVFSIVAAVELVVLYPAGIWADARGRRTVLVPSLAALTVMTVALAWASGPVSLGLLLGVFGLASGIAGVPPAAMLADVSPQRGAGKAVGIFRFCGDVGLVLGPVVAGAAAARFDFAGAFAVSAVPTAAALIVVLWAPETLAAGERI
jgi:DHA1 family multidrug resistance protein-like MFS transporter